MKHRKMDSIPRRIAWLSPQLRSWAYAVILALIPLLATAGWVSDTTAPLWVGLAAAFLGIGTASAHMPAHTSDNTSLHGEGSTDDPI